MNDWKFVKNKFAIAAVAALAAITLTAAPAFAVNNLSTINSTGGTSLNDGLKVDIANGQIQVLRDGSGQLYGPDSLPDPLVADAMSNYFTVAYTDGESNFTIAPDGGGEVGYDWDYIWETYDSSATLSQDGKSGTVVNTLTSESIDGLNVILEVTFTYTYPDQFVNVSTKLTLPTGWTFPTRVYWNTDSTLGGADEGNQFEGVLSSGQQVRGVVSPDGSQIEAFRQVVGQNINSWAGQYTCPWNDQGTDCNDAGTYGWVYSNDDAPNSIAAGTDLDNGFGISTPVVSAAGEYATSFDLLFVGCLDGVEALQCINDNVNPAPAPAPDPELANTGASVAAPFGTGLAILLAGLAVVLVRRKGSRLTD